MHEAIFTQVSKVIEELWPFVFAKMWLHIDFGKLNSMDVIVMWLNLVSQTPPSDALH